MAKNREESNEKLAVLMADFNKKFGKGVIIDAKKKEAYGEVIATTPFSLRNALGIGGFAKRKLYTIDGDTSAGKSTTAYDIIGNCQKLYGDMCLLIDKEDSYTTIYGEKLGIDNEKLVIATPDTLEDMYELLTAALQSGLFGTIVVDSITSFAPKALDNGVAVPTATSKPLTDFTLSLRRSSLLKTSPCANVSERLLLSRTALVSRLDAVSSSSRLEIFNLSLRDIFLSLKAMIKI
jgi:RecA/RadA recombinase